MGEVWLAIIIVLYPMAFEAILHHDQGRAAEARSLLQSVYDRFSEVFQTADLRTAKAYLDSLQQ